MPIKKADMRLVDPSGRPVESGAGRLPRVLIGVPCGLQTFVAFEDSLQYAIKGVGTYFEGVVNRAIGYITADGRNQLVKQAMEGNFDFVFFADSDMIFPPGTLVKMLRKVQQVPEDELPILTGIYNTRSDHRLNVYRWLPDQTTYEAINGNADPDFHLHQEKLYRTDGCGTGCMLIDCRVFDVIEWPWFTYEHWTHKDKREWWSEDLVFCKKLYDKGIHVYVDTEIICKHILPTVVVQISDTEYQVERLSGAVY